MRYNLFSKSEPRLHRSQPEQQNNEYSKQVTTTTFLKYAIGSSVYMIKIALP